MGEIIGNEVEENSLKILGLFPSELSLHVALTLASNLAEWIKRRTIDYLWAVDSPVVTIVSVDPEGNVENVKARNTQIPLNHPLNRSSTSSTQNLRYAIAIHLRLGESLEDEWYLTSILFDLSLLLCDGRNRPSLEDFFASLSSIDRVLFLCTDQSYLSAPDCDLMLSLVLQITDSDGEFLLIESSEYLPSWMDPDRVSNRCVVYNGLLHVLPSGSSRDLPVSVRDQLKNVKTVLDTADFVRSHSTFAVCSDDVQGILHDRFTECLESSEHITHTTRVILPAAAAYLLIRTSLKAPSRSLDATSDVVVSSLLPGIAAAFYHRTPAEMSSASRFKLTLGPLTRFEPAVDTEDYQEHLGPCCPCQHGLMGISLRMRKEHFAQMALQPVHPPRPYSRLLERWWTREVGSSSSREVADFPPVFQGFEKHTDLLMNPEHPLWPQILMGVRVALGVEILADLDTEVREVLAHFWQNFNFSSLDGSVSKAVGGHAGPCTLCKELRNELSWPPVAAAHESEEWLHPPTAAADIETAALGREIAAAGTEPVESEPFDFFKVSGMHAHKDSSSKESFAELGASGELEALIGKLGAFLGGSSGYQGVEVDESEGGDSHDEMEINREKIRKPKSFQRNSSSLGQSLLPLAHPDGSDDSKKSKDIWVSDILPPGYSDDENEDEDEEDEEEEDAEESVEISQSKDPQAFNSTPVEGSTGVDDFLDALGAAFSALAVSSPTIGKSQEAAVTDGNPTMADYMEAMDEELYGCDSSGGLHDEDDTYNDDENGSVKKAVNQGQVKKARVSTLSESFLRDPDLVEGPVERSSEREKRGILTPQDMGFNLSVSLAEAVMSQGGASGPASAMIQSLGVPVPQSWWSDRSNNLKSEKK